VTGDRPLRRRLSGPLVVTVIAVVSVAVATDVSTDAAHLAVPPGIRVGSGVATEVLAGHTVPVPGAKPGRTSPPATVTTTTTVAPAASGGASSAGTVVVQTIIGPTGVAVGRVSSPTVTAQPDAQPSTVAPSSPPPATTVPTTTTTTPVPTTTRRSGGGGGGSGDDHGGDNGGHSDDPSTTINTVGPDYPVVTSPGYTPPTSTDS